MSVLGKETVYPTKYAPELLFPIARDANRNFFGEDVWRAYEISWLDMRGKPVVATAEFRFPCTSPFLIESKSFKLYLNSFNSEKYASADDVLKLVRADLAKACGSPVTVNLSFYKQELLGSCLDELDVTCMDYHPNPSLLKINNEIVDEAVYSHLLKSNCPVTSQPDWGTVEISYRGQKIDHASLLQYIVSYREHDEFHENCVESMFRDILTKCKPERLTVQAFYTRRGGLDINPFRSTHASEAKRVRLQRQ